MGRKKKRSAPSARDRIFCYYCDRTFHQQQELLSHQRDKHLRCPVCNKRMISVQSMVVHAEQMHNTHIQTVPNAVPGRESVAVDVLGMQGIPNSYYAALDAEHTKRPRQHPAPVEPPIHNVPTPFIPSHFALNQNPPHLSAPYSSVPVSPYHIQRLDQPSPHLSFPAHARLPSASQSQLGPPHSSSVYHSIAPRSAPSDTPLYRTYTASPPPSSRIGSCPDATTEPPPRAIPSTHRPIASSSYSAFPSYTPLHSAPVSEPHPGPYSYAPPRPPPTTAAQAPEVRPVPVSNRPAYLLSRPAEVLERYEHPPSEHLGSNTPQRPPPEPSRDRVLFESRHISLEEMRALLPRYRTELRYTSQRALQP